MTTPESGTSPPGSTEMPMSRGGGYTLWPVVKRRFLVVLALLLVVRCGTIVLYHDKLYYYGMVANQFAIAEGAYYGHWFAQDKVRSEAVCRAAEQEERYIPLEAWNGFPSSGVYTTFPAQDLPGYGYIIALTSLWLDDHLTSRYAMVIQVAVEATSVLLFAYCVALVLGAEVGWLTGLVYVLGYPFIWPIASQPMRDVFGLAVYACCVAAFLVFVRFEARRAAWVSTLLLLSLASLLLWVRPHCYYFLPFLVPLAMLARGRPVGERLAFSFCLIAMPWLIFGLPLERFNLRHYGVRNTDAIGTALWGQLGIVKGNKYGFARKDSAIVPWVKAHYGKDVGYMTPEMNRLAGDYARSVIRSDPAYYLKAEALILRELLKTPLDWVPPFRTVEYTTSGLSLAQYARSYPASFAFKVLNRVLVYGFFYGGLLLTLHLMMQRRRDWLQLAVLLSPCLYTICVQLAVGFTSRYMAIGCWVLTVPFAYRIRDALKHE